MLAAYPNLIKMSTKPGPMGFSTSIQVICDKSILITGSDSNPQQSEEKALENAFRMLNNLAFLMQSFTTSKFYTQ